MLSAGALVSARKVFRCGREGKRAGGRREEGRNGNEWLFLADPSSVAKSELAKEEPRVKRRLILICVCLGVLGMAPAMFADVTDYLFNLNGASYCSTSSTVSGCSSYGGLAAVPGLVSTLDESNGGTGLGSLTLTFNPGAGSYNVDFWLFEQLSVQPAQATLLTCISLMLKPK